MSGVRGIRLTTAQADIYSVLKDYGPLPDHALVPLAQHVTKVRQASSGIRSRRAELERLGLVADTGVRVRTASGRQAVVYRTV